MNAHLDEDELSRYAEGISGEDERSRLQTHLSACADCRQVVAELVRCPRSPDDSLSSDPFEGLHVGRYQLGPRLGAGAMGVVYRARDPILQRDVALKLVRNLDLPESRDQLVAAARAMAQIEHKNVLRIFDAGVDRDEVFVVSALAEGGDLRGWIVNTPGTQLGAAFVELAEGLAAVHEAGLLHRDIKPDNILVAGDNSLLLADVGFAASSAPNAITPAYLAPELLEGAAASPAADQYALALSLCEAFTGKRPGNADDAARDMKRAGAPRHVIAAVHRGLSVDPGKRFPSATRFAQALRGRQRWGAWLAAAAVVAALAVAGGVVVGSKSDSSVACLRNPLRALSAHRKPPGGKCESLCRSPRAANPTLR